MPTSWPSGWPTSGLIYESSWWLLLGSEGSEAKWKLVLHSGFYRAMVDTKNPAWPKYTIVPLSPRFSVFRFMQDF